MNVQNYLNQLRTNICNRLQKKQPEIEYFECVTPYIVENGFFSLQWKVNNAHKITISNIGIVEQHSKINLIAKSINKTFTLTAHGYETTINKTLSIKIIPLEYDIPKVRLKEFEIFNIQQNIRIINQSFIEKPQISLCKPNIQLLHCRQKINWGEIQITVSKSKIKIKKEPISFQIPQINENIFEKIYELDSSEQLDLMHIEI